MTQLLIEKMSRLTASANVNQKKATFLKGKEVFASSRAKLELAELGLGTLSLRVVSGWTPESCTAVFLADRRP